MKKFITKFPILLCCLLIHFGVKAQQDTLCSPTEATKIFGEAFLTYGTFTNAYTVFNRTDVTIGQSLTTTVPVQSVDYQTGLGYWAKYLLPPQAPALIASQGDYKDHIQLSWQVNPLSPAPSSFVIRRNGAFLAEVNADVQEYLDFNVQAGEFYQYSIVAKNAFGQGSPIQYVGFVNPNGVVSGKIESSSGNPVPGVEVRLTPLTGASLLFDGTSGQLCVSYNDKFPTSAFTVSAYVKLGANNNESGIIDWGSGLNKNWWITTTGGSEPKGYIFHIGNGTGSDTLKYYLPVDQINLPNNPDNWHQITMVYNGSAMSVMVDGSFVGTKPAVIVREKQHFNIGSKNDGAFFKGNLDDVRIYNRPLTETEIKATKNRTVSKTENGLVAYWKMDEGIGAKAFDNANTPTNATIYGGVTFSNDKAEVYNTGISDVTGYYSIDGVNYSSNESFRASPLKNFEYNTALEFSAADKSYGNLADYDIPDTSTVEVLFHPFDLKARQTVISKGSLYEVYVNNGKLFVSLNGTISDLGTISAKYYHLAVAMNNSSGNAKIYLNGELKGDISFSGTSNWANGSPWLLATNNVTPVGKFYTGLIDEIAIYKNALPQNEIQVHYVTGIPQDSTAANLFSYFDLNEGTDTKVYDYAAINAGASAPRVGILTKANWSNTVKNSASKPHEFEPNIRVVNLNSSNTAIGNVDFKDVSTVSISGTVRFANTFCFEDTVEIYSNGQPLFPPVRTDRNGKWSIDFEPGVNVKLTAVYKDHVFSPGFMEFKKLQAPKAGIVFLDNTKRVIRGQVAGGACRKSVIPNGARVVVKIATLDGCFEKTDTLKNPDGKFVFKDLPARAFRVSVVEHSNSVIYNYFQTKGGQQVDLRDIEADTVDFIYIAPPKVEVQGIAANQCGQKTVGQNVLNKIKVKVYEQYDGGKCYVDGATFSINDPSSNTNTDTTLAKGVYEYEHFFYPKTVITIPPYKTVMTVEAKVNASSSVDTTSFVVLGMKPRGGTFTSSSPEMPLFVLRDPPGDASYAVLEKGSSYCYSTTREFSNGISGEVSLGLSVGGTQSIGVGAEIQTTNKVTVSVAGGGNVKWSGSNNEQTCITTTQTISTSPNDGVVGSLAGGDVYVGITENVTYGGADLLNLDFNTCQFTIKPQISIDAVRMKSNFFYSEKHIINDVIPSLELLASQPASVNPTRKADSLAAVTWKQYIQQNKEDRGALVKSISFDAGAIVEESEETESTNSWSQTIDGSAWVEAGVKAEIDWLGGFTAETKLKYEHTELKTTDGSNATKAIITYHFEDDDQGDNFFVNIYKGKRWRDTYIFETKAGESSCPWEFSTKQRTRPALISMDGLTKVNVPTNTPAVFQLALGNDSPTGEGKTYTISMQNGTNPNGAIVKIDGQPLTQPISYFINAGESAKVTLTVEKGPVAYDYRDIIIRMEAPCETGVADETAVIDSLFLRTVALNVSFVEPCSPVDIGFPLQNFVVTPASQNVLSITLNEYSKNDANLKLIRLQYRPIGGDGSWINIKTFNPSELGDVFTIYNWQTMLLQDGDYEIRAVTECFDVTKASGISTVVKGSFQRIPPEVVGVPQPADGTWDPGDEISITFSKPIKCDKVIQADILANNTIGLYDATTNKLVDATISCLGNKIIIVPRINAKDFENRTFRVIVTGKDYDDAQLATNPNYQPVAIRDKAGNAMEKTVKWEFYVNQNNLEWIGSDIIESNTVLQPFTVKRQIRNRGGSITSFRMEGIPSWLTVTPATGTLNPGQVADVTFTFQQDLLIGDYKDTVNMVGSQGSEPMLIDYRVRCPQPNYIVDNPSQYEGTMNMVVALNIFGKESTDPSDVIIARIDNQVRGVGKVAYYRNINKWLAFITIYGNADDASKKIDFSVWQGVKCNEYADVLEQFTYEESALIGSPLEPTPMHVLNLVSKCVPLNKGWNWASFNIDLGTGNNTVTNFLSSMKTKAGAFIKDDNLFSKYYGSPYNAWKNTLKNIVPEKRYMIFAAEKDTICLKGTPQIASDHPIDIIQGWNWIGYVPSSGMTVTQALRGLTPLNGDIIKSQTLFAQFVAGIGWVGNLNFLEPQKGYILKISNAGRLIYPEQNAALINSFNEAYDAQPAELKKTDLAFDFSKYQSTMNIIGQIDGISIEADDELRAYIDNTLVGVNKSILNGKKRLFFETIYHEDALNINFKLYKADRKKELDLSRQITFKKDSLAGFVENPVVFSLATNNNAEVTLTLADQIIAQPVKVFQDVAIKMGIAEPNANCTTFAINSILPMSNEMKPNCNAQPGLEGNMNGVIQVVYNERSSFVSSEDVLTFINPVNGNAVGCGSFDATDNIFDFTVKGGTSSTETPVDVKYYSALMKKTFTLKSALTYRNNKILGDLITPYVIDLSPLSVNVDANGVIKTVMRDTSWTGKYSLDIFAMNCSGFNDGRTTFTFQRLKQGDCVELELRKVSENQDKIIQALSISSDALINSGVNIFYKGGNVIELKPGFDTSNGAIFTGKIEGCNNKTP